MLSGCSTKYVGCVPGCERGVAATEPACALREAIRDGAERERSASGDADAISMSIRHESLDAHSEKTNNIPPHDVYRARSGSVVPRSRTSYGRLAATSPAMSNPISPPMPA